MVDALVKCERCGLEVGVYHGEVCTIKAVEYREDGTVRVEYLTPMDYPQVANQELEQDYPRLKATR